MPHSYEYPRAALTVDCVVFGLDEEDLKVMLIQRDLPPFEGEWALPGGFVRVDENGKGKVTACGKAPHADFVGIDVECLCLAAEDANGFLGVGSGCGQVYIVGIGAFAGAVCRVGAIFEDNGGYALFLKLECDFVAFVVNPDVVVAAAREDYDADASVLFGRGLV